MRPSEGPQATEGPIPPGLLFLNSPTWSGWVSLGFLGVGPAAGGFPLVPAGFGLGNFPAGCLFDLVAGAASCSGVARARPAALVVGDGVVEVAVFGVAGAGREGALGVADL